MKKLYLSDTQFSLVDEEDHERLSLFKWSLAGRYAKRGVVGRSKSEFQYLHHAVLGLAHGEYVDHINGDGLDNRKVNLRPCTHKENLYNRGPNKNNTSGYKGVGRGGNKWTAQLSVGDMRGTRFGFNTAEEAARAYDEAAKKFFGPFAWLNFKEGGL